MCNQSYCRYRKFECIKHKNRSALFTPNSGYILAAFSGFIYDASNSYQVAFYIAGAVPTAAACMMFGIPFLMPEREEDKKCRVVLAEESGYNEKPTYFDEKRALAEKEQQMYRDRYTGIPEVIIEEPETEDNLRPVSFYSMASNDNALSTLSINNKRNTIGLSTNSISTVRET